MLPPPAAWLAVGTGSGCSSPCHLSSKEFEPVFLWLSRKNAELFCSTAQLFGHSGDGHAAIRGLHWLSWPHVSPFVLWHGNTSMLLPVSPGQQCSARWALGAWCLLSQILVHSALQAGSRHVSSCHACPVSSTHQDAVLGSTLLAPLWHLRGHSDNCINFLMIVALVPVSGNLLGLTVGPKARRKSVTAAPLPICHPQPILGVPSPCLQKLSPAFGICHQRGLRATAAVPQVLPRQGSHRLQPSCKHVLEMAAEKLAGNGLTTSRAFLKQCSSGADVMTQLEGLLLAEEAGAHPLQPGGRVPLLRVHCPASSSGRVS